MTADRVLTIPEAKRLATLIDWADRKARLMWVNAYASRHDVIHGTARSIGDDNGNFLGAGEDVRDAWLRITTVAGYEWFVPVADALAFIEHGEMVEDADDLSRREPHTVYTRRHSGSGSGSGSGSTSATAGADAGTLR